jgi:hypothetical protein
MITASGVLSSWVSSLVSSLLASSAACSSCSRWRSSVASRSARTQTGAPSHVVVTARISTVRREPSSSTSSMSRRPATCGSPKGSPARLPETRWNSSSAAGFAYRTIPLLVDDQQPVRRGGEELREQLGRGRARAHVGGGASGARGVGGSGRGSAMRLSSSGSPMCIPSSVDRQLPYPQVVGRAAHLQHRHGPVEGRARFEVAEEDDAVGEHRRLRFGRVAAAEERGRDGVHARDAAFLDQSGHRHHELPERLLAGDPFERREAVDHQPLGTYGVDPFDDVDQVLLDGADSG